MRAHAPRRALFPVSGAVPGLTRTAPLTALELRPEIEETELHPARIYACLELFRGRDLVRVHFGAEKKQ